MPPTFAIKRIYEPPSPDDGFRVLVDRLWPRGVSKERAALDLWAKDVTPSPELRDLWHADRERFDDFAARYRAELDESDAIDALLDATAGEQHVTLIYAYRDPDRNHAHVLLAAIHARLRDRA